MLNQATGNIVYPLLPEENTFFPDMPCMKKGLQGQKSVGLLVGIYERRALLVPVINRLPTACKPVILFPHSVYMGFRLFVLWRDVQAMCLRCFGGYEGRLSPGRTVLSASNPARPRPAALPCAPTRPARGMFEFWVRQIFNICEMLYTCWLQNADTPRSSRVWAAHADVAGRGWARQ